MYPKVRTYDPDSGCFPIEGEDYKIFSQKEILRSIGVDLAKFACSSVFTVAVASAPVYAYFSEDVERPDSSNWAPIAVAFAVATYTGLKARNQYKDHKHSLELLDVMLKEGIDHLFVLNPKLTPNDTPDVTADVMTQRAEKLLLSGQIPNIPKLGMVVATIPVCQFE